MRIRPFLKPILNRILPPVTRWYLRRPRTFRKEGLEVVVYPGVFHPGMYFSTQYLLKSMKDLDWKGKTVLELGAGSGFLSLWLARQGAKATASDINEIAVEKLKENAARNGVELECIHSDLFSGLSSRRFSFVLVNPPYYPGTPSTPEEYAWYCGEGFEYFQRFFSGLGEVLQTDGRAWMVLSEDCDLQRIREVAEDLGWTMKEHSRTRTGGEWNYIFDLVQK